MFKQKLKFNQIQQNVFFSLVLSLLILAYITNISNILFGYNFRDNLNNFITGNKFQDFITLTLSIIVEAFPFVILGIIVSIILGLLVKENWLLRILPKNNILSNFIISLFGTFMPVCECGNIPVARRLIIKGFSVSQAITFLLAAPIVNPITLYSTITAFNYDPSIAVIRIIGALFVSNIIGFLISQKKNQKEFLTNYFLEGEYCDHDHSTYIPLFDYIKNNYKNFWHKKEFFSLIQKFFRSASDIFRTEFTEIIKMLIVGAVFAGISQTFIPRDVILSIGQSPVLSVIAMMILAFVISICSNVDAFFALSYANTFTNGSILTFLIFGPMIDIKILTMLKSTFKAYFLAFLFFAVGILSLIIGLTVNYFL